MLADALLAKWVLEYVGAKIMSPGHKKQATQAAVHDGVCSRRAVCRILHLARSTYHYPQRGLSPRQQRLLTRREQLSGQYPRYGYRRIAALLRQKGWPVGKRSIQKLRRHAGLRVPPTKRKIIRRGHSDGTAHQGDAPRPRLDLGLHR